MDSKILQSAKENIFEEYSYKKVIIYAKTKIWKVVNQN